MTPLNVLYLIAGGLLAASALLAVVRIVRGPTILDRMIASDVVLTILILVVGAEMVISGHTRTIPIMLVLTGTAAVATIAVARYVSKQDHGEGPSAETPSAETPSADNPSATDSRDAKGTP